jgi:hypothetical protein
MSTEKYKFQKLFLFLSFTVKTKQHYPVIKEVHLLSLKHLLRLLKDFLAKIA